MRTRFFMVVGILVGLAVLTGCSEESKIRSKAKWLCKFGAVEQLETRYLPEDEEPKNYIRSEDLAYMKSKKGDSNDSPALGEAFAAGFAPVARAMRTARAEHTDCKVTDIKVEGNAASATVHRSVPQPDVGFDSLGELNSLDSERKQLEKARKFYANAASEDSDEYQVDFEKGDNGWRANLHLEKMDLLEDRDKTKAKLKDARSNLAEIQERQKQAQEARKNLENFQILEADFRQRRQRYTGSLKPVIILKIRNETGHAISHAFFHGVVQSPGREVPWIEESFNYEVPGGVEPDETVRWSLAPNMFSSWGETEVPDDVEFSVSVTRLEGAGGGTLYRLPSEDLSKQRAELERKVKKLEKELDSYEARVSNL